MSEPISTSPTSPTPTSPMPSSPLPPRRPLWRRIFAAKPIIHLLFWSWHAVWVLGVLFGVAPHVLPRLLVDSVHGLVPWGITLSAIVLTVLPGFTLLAGWRLRHDHWKLLRLFYGVGGVAFTLLFIRLFFIREATGGVQFLLGTLAVGAAFYTAELFGGLRRVGRGPAVVRMVGYSALLVIGLYAGVVMGLYSLPGVVLAIPKLFEGLWEVLTSGELLRVLAYSPFILAFILFMLYSFTLLLGLPIAVAVLYTRGWWRGLEAFAAEHSRGLGLAITAACVGVWISGLGVLSQQPQREAFERLGARPADLTAQGDNLADAEDIRDGLLNAYLSPHRYWGARDSTVQLARLYRNAFGFEYDVMGPQYVFNAMAAPLLYDGSSMAADRKAAEVRYEQFFDRPLQEGEREAVLAAVSATYDRTQAEAGLLDVGQRKVLLQEQAIHMETHGDLARFTLHEVYLNQTFEQQEIFYYFNLPEHAAVTGLWLGDDDTLSRRFPYVVSPRGAAQQVYREQREQRVDPALLEQVGPRQYRLRAFPIPARNRREGTDEATPLHLWMEWTVLGDSTGWPAPQLAEARNVYWDRDDTARTIDGMPADHDGWLPSHFKGDATAQAHELDVGGFRVRAVPTSSPVRSVGLYGRLAVVLETSLSMQEHAGEVKEILGRFADSGAEVDLYIAPSPWSAEQPRLVSLDKADPHYYGGHTLVGALAQFDVLRGNARHDAIIVLSDAGSFAFLQDDALPNPRTRRGLDGGAQAQLAGYKSELAAAAATVANARVDAPVWVWHLGGLPHAYRDEVGDLLQRSHGGVVTEFDELKARLDGGSLEGHAWSFEPLGHESIDAADDAAAESSDDPFGPLAARALVAHLATQMDAPTPEHLDRIHAVAVQGSVVTPWSSMIVLVNDAQREALRRASEASDRFDREAESGTEDTTTPMAGLELAATPEPEEWLLLSLIVLALGWRMRSMRIESCMAGA